MRIHSLRQRLTSFAPFHFVHSTSRVGSQKACIATLSADGLIIVSEVNIDQLVANVAPNAILNAGGRADEVRCFPGTREELIRKIEKWMSDQTTRASRMLWLSGPAGAGKSAIAQTVAERCNEHGQQAANFFFFRGDGTRNRAEPLVATLVYQLRRFYPTLNESITDCLTADPLICRAPIHEQFRQLVSSPFRTLQQSPSTDRSIILIIDGLDECDDERKQEEILLALRVLSDANDSPFRVLVASRAESHLVMAFNKLGTSVESIFLNDEYQPEDDIRRFVAAKFDEIKGSHRLAHTLPKEWPEEADIRAIIDKSSGQFIYAATVMRFIEYSSASPALSLLRVHGMRPSGNHSPLAQLDAVYSYIFSKTDDFQAVKLILGAHLVLHKISDAEYVDLLACLRIVGYTALDVESLMADLAAIVQVVHSPRIGLVFYHASLPDYLKDKSRSGIYQVDEGEMAVALSLICLKNFDDSGSLDRTFTILWHVKAPTVALSESLLMASTRSFENGLSYVEHWDQLIRTVMRLYKKTDKALFRSLLQSWASFACRNKIPNTIVSANMLDSSDLGYYKRCLTTAQIKSALGLKK